MKRSCSDILIEWYRLFGRRLPWRETTDPYLIWISEIILQQTRVVQGTDYYRRFITRFPHVASLAAATQDEVMKYWQGLGYYSRARNLHVAARLIVAEHGGLFPKNYESVLSLPGIGPYTAAAVCSFAYGLPIPVVDGNVYRVLARLHDIDTPIDTRAGTILFQRLAEADFDPSRAALWNQAIMDFGALVCTPAQPDCPDCPLQETCLSLQRGTTAARPVKQGKGKTRPRWFHYFHITCAGTTWLNRRTGGDIWAGLYEFPLIETEGDTDYETLVRSEPYRRLFVDARRVRLIGTARMPKHILSHQVIHAVFYRIELDAPSPTLTPYRQTEEALLGEYAVSRLTERYLENYLPADRPVTSQ